MRPNPEVPIDLMPGEKLEQGIYWDLQKNRPFYLSNINRFWEIYLPGRDTPTLLKPENLDIFASKVNSGKLEELELYAEFIKKYLQNNNF